MTHAEKIEALKTMIENKRFHHATQRFTGPGLSNGLFIYEKAEGDEGFRGYKLAMSFWDGLCYNDADAIAQEREAHALVVSAGIYEGSYS